jgi:hypothetical protein
MINIKKTIHSITVKNGLLYDFGEKMHEEISNFLAPYIINNEELTDEKINQEIIAVKHVMDALQSHPDLVFHLKIISKLFLILKKPLCL